MEIPTKTKMAQTMKHKIEMNNEYYFCLKQMHSEESNGSIYMNESKKLIKSLGKNGDFAKI